MIPVFRDGCLEVQSLHFNFRAFALQSLEDPCSDIQTCYSNGVILHSIAALLQTSGSPRFVRLTQTSGFTCTTTRPYPIHNEDVFRCSPLAHHPLQARVVQMVQSMLLLAIAAVFHTPHLLQGRAFCGGLVC